MMADRVGESRLEQLRELRNILAEQIDVCTGSRDLAQLVKQYRETLIEIEEIEGAEDDDDEINDILKKRETDGKSGAVR